MGRTRMIKYHKKNILWSTTNVQGTLVNIINCYIPPYKNKESKEIVEKLKEFIRNIVKNPNHYPVIIGGDFNHTYQEINEFSRRVGLKEVFNNTMTFPRSGNQLDGVFTDLKILSRGTSERDYTDHL
jgi:endonuclease/exonuclease/phosphatase (EEP) superfamily protein YafD